MHGLDDLLVDAFASFAGFCDSQQVIAPDASHPARCGGEEGIEGDLAVVALYGAYKRGRIDDVQLVAEEVECDGWQLAVFKTV